jgi:hypothetical protein
MRLDFTAARRTRVPQRPAGLGMIRHLVYQGVALGRQGVSAILNLVYSNPKKASKGYAPDVPRVSGFHANTYETWMKHEVDRARGLRTDAPRAPAGVMSTCASAA